MRKRRSFHHTGLMGADRPISIDLWDTCSVGRSSQIGLFDPRGTSITIFTNSTFTNSTAAGPLEIGGRFGSLTKPTDREGDNGHAVEASGRSIPTGWLLLPD